MDTQARKNTLSYFSRRKTKCNKVRERRERDKKLKGEKAYYFGDGPWEWRIEQKQILQL